MAFKIIWSRQARDDLRDIVTFIAADDHIVAESFGFRLMAKVDALAEFPHIGRVVPEEQDENVREIVLRPYRFLPVKSGRIISQILNLCLSVSNLWLKFPRIWHGARGKPEIPTRLEF